jgi:hypothetical protein
MLAYQNTSFLTENYSLKKILWESYKRIWESYKNSGKIKMARYHNDKEPEPKF